MGLSSALSYEMRRRRLWERVRVTMFAWMKESSSLVFGKYRKPTPSVDIEGTPMISPSEDSSSKDDPSGVRQEIVSPEWCFTSTMTVTLLTLFAGSEILPQETSGVEFYYVVKGEGIHVDGEGNEEELELGSCLVVDPLSVRGFKATGRTDLVLLRATDTQDGQDTARRKKSSLSTAVAILRVGLNKVEDMVATYGTPRHQEEKKDDFENA